jgi:monofunctional glycosyltransferase
MLRRRHGRSRWRRWLLRILIAVAAAIGLGFALVLPLRWFEPATSAFMLEDRSGRKPLLQEWVEWEQTGSAAPLAVVAAEDQKFADHFGFDVGSIRDSLEDAEDGGRLRGASTISQQMVKNLFLWPGRSFLRKGLEAWFTVVAEICLPKRRILEIYLNVAEFGPGIYGIGAASSHYFGKPPSRLTDPEAALLAAVLPNPHRLHADSPSSYVRERQRWILTQMARLRRESWLSRL